MMSDPLAVLVSIGYLPASPVLGFAAVELGLRLGTHVMPE